MQNNRSNLLPEVRSLLQTLLAQAEQEGRKQVVRVRLTKDAHRWYVLGETIGLRYAVNEQLQMLAAQGLVRLHWHKHEEGNLLAAVDLEYKQADVLEQLYRLLGQTPLRLMKEQLRQLLMMQEPVPGWHQSFLTRAIEQLDTNKSVAPLSLSDSELNRDLLLALSAIARLKSPILERTLSIQLFSRSKRLEELRRAIIGVLKTHSLEAASYGEDDWALLQAHFLRRSPEYVPVIGPLCLEISRSSERESKTTQLSLDAQFPSIALSETILRTATITSCPATALLTVENLTSFHELLFLRPASLMIIFTGGFASPSLITFLSHIRDCRPDLPFFHWGDIDIGGLRILAHLRRFLGTILPVGMDIATFDTGRAYAQPFTSQDRIALNTLLTVAHLADCLPLMQHLQHTCLKLEQEAVHASYIIDQLRQRC